MMVTCTSEFMMNRRLVWSEDMAVGGGGREGGAAIGPVSRSTCTSHISQAHLALVTNQ